MSAAPAVIGLGEALWDVFPDQRRPGGAPANVAFHAQQLGLRGVICSRVGVDALGDELCDYLAQRGLDVDAVQRDPQRPTGTVDVHAAGDGPAYTIHEDVAWDRLELSDVWRRELSACAAVCFGTLAQRSATSRDAIRAGLTLADGAWRIYDVNLRPPFYDADTVVESLRLCHVAKFNDQEAPELARLLGLNADDPTALAAALRRAYDVRLTAITRGGAGAWLVTPDQAVAAPSAPVQVADTVGAGDAFTAGLACGLVQGWPLEATAALANGVAGLVASRPGAMPLLADEIPALLERAWPQG